MKLLLKIDFVLDPVSEFGGTEMNKDVYIIIKEFFSCFSNFTSGEILLENDGEFGRFNGTDELAVLCDNLYHAVYLVNSDQEEKNNFTLKVSYFKNAINIRCELSSLQESEIDVSPVNYSINFLVKVWRQLKELYYLSDDSGLALWEFSYPHFFPPKSLLDWGEANVLDVFQAVGSWTDIESLDQEEKTLLDKMQSLPDIVESKLEGELAIIKWVENFKEADVAFALLAREKWFAENFDLPPEVGYNELGDHLEPGVDLEAYPSFGFYNSITETGYVKVFDDANTVIDEGRIIKAKQWLDKRSLPGGINIQNLLLIAPNRNAALDIMNKAKSMGFEKVLYLDDDSYLWNPDNS